MPLRRRKPPRAGALTDLPPLKIIRGIVLLQLAYYIIAIVLNLFTAVVAGTKFSFALIFDWRTVRGDNTLGWTFGFVWLLVAFVSVIPLLLLVSRSKLVPDFALTVHFLDLLVTSFYTRALPTNLLWWILQFCSAALMVSLGMWACQWRELRPISFGDTSVTRANLDTQQAPDADEDLTVHAPSGRDRGRKRDDSSGYEMVGIKDGSDAV